MNITINDDSHKKIIGVLMILLTFTFAVSVVVVGADPFGFCEGLEDYCLDRSTGEIGQSVGLVSLVLFVVLTPQLFMRSQIFYSWIKFAIPAIILGFIWMLGRPIYPMGGGIGVLGHGPGASRESATMIFGVLFFLVSIIIIIFKAIKNKRMMKNLQNGFAPILILLIMLGGGYYVVSKKSQVNMSPPVVATSTTQTPVKPSPNAYAQAHVVLPVATVMKNTNMNVAELKIISTLGWPAKVNSSVVINGSIESLPGMVVVKVVPVTSTGAEYLVNVGGLPANTDLHVYTNGYRVHEVKRTSAEGSLEFKLTTPMQFIIKDTPS